MPAETTTEVAEVAALLAKAAESGLDAFAAFRDVMQLADNPSGVPLTLHDAEALLGQAYMARRHIEWSLDESKKVLRALAEQVDLAKEASDG